MVSNIKDIGLLWIKSRLIFFAFSWLMISWAPAHGSSDPSNSAFGAFSAYELNQEFLTNSGMSKSQFYDWVNSHMATLGAGWTRSTNHFRWVLIEPVLGEGYDWNNFAYNTDSLLKNLYQPGNEIDMLAVICPCLESDRSPISDQQDYADFITALAERYDGDGFQDHDTNIRLNYFQFVNETQDWFDKGYSADEYAQAAETTLNALRAANPDARLVLIAQAGEKSGLGKSLKDAITACATRGVDFSAVDIHLWGNADDWQSDTLTELRSYLDGLGLEDVEIWSTENGTYVGCPAGKSEQTETDQARSLVKRFAWGRANGLDRIFWNNLVDFYEFGGDDSHFFNGMGLIGDGELICDPVEVGEERLSYWSFKLLSQYTDNLSAKQFGEMNITNSDVYGYEYRSRSTGFPVYVIWHETGSATVTLPETDRSANVMSLITDSDGTMEAYTVSYDSSPIAITVNQDPVMVVVTDSTITVAPVANAGPDQNVSEKSTAQLDGANSSDPNDDPLTYEWHQVQGEAVDISDPTSAQTTFTTPDVGPDGESLAFELTVTDPDGYQTTDRVVVNVTWINQGPVANAGLDQTVEQGSTVSLDATGSYDLDDGIAAYSWTQTEGTPVTLSDQSFGQPTFTAPDVGPDGKSFTFEVTVTDTGGLQATDSCIINVTWINRAPKASGGPDQTVVEGSTVSLDGTGTSDDDDGIRSYAWTQTSGPPVTLSSTQTADPTFVTPPVAISGNTLAFLLTVTDRGGLQATDSVSITVNDNGITGFPEDVLTFMTAKGQPAGIKDVNGGYLVRLDVMDSDNLGSMGGKPQIVSYGLFDFQIRLDDPGGTVDVTFYLPTSAPDGYKWYKYHESEGWSDFSGNADFNADRSQITITLTDGGDGDDDRTVDAFVSDPSGLGSPQLIDETVSSGGGGGGGGGCFISTAAQDQ